MFWSTLYRESITYIFHFFFFRFQLHEKFSPHCPVFSVLCVWILEDSKHSWAASPLTSCSESYCLQTIFQPWDVEELQKALVGYLKPCYMYYTVIMLNGSYCMCWTELHCRSKFNGGIVGICNSKSYCGVVCRTNAILIQSSSFASLDCLLNTAGVSWTKLVHFLF